MRQWTTKKAMPTLHLKNASFFSRVYSPLRANDWMLPWTGAGTNKKQQRFLLSVIINVFDDFPTREFRILNVPVLVKFKFDAFDIKKSELT